MIARALRPSGVGISAQLCGWSWRRCSSTATPTALGPLRGIDAVGSRSKLLRMLTEQIPRTVRTLVNETTRMVVGYLRWPNSEINYSAIAVLKARTTQRSKARRLVQIKPEISKE
jgi:hypothetical protein